MGQAGARPTRQDAWRQRGLTVALFLSLSVLLVASANSGPAQVNDTRASALASWSLGTLGHTALPDVWPASANYWGVETPSGEIYTNRFPGVAYWAAPAYALASTFDPRPAPAHPFLVDLRPASWTAAVTVAAAGVAGFVLLRRTLPQNWALGSSLVLILGTGLWSVAADSLWPHGPAALFLLIGLFGWRDQHRLVVIGAAAGAVLVRPHIAVALVVLAIYAWFRDGDRRDGLAFLGGTGLGLAMLSAYSLAVFGVWTPTAGYDPASHLEGLVVHGPGQTIGAITGALVGTERGVLLFSPILAVAGVAVVIAWRQLPAWTLASAAAGLAYLLIQVRAVGHLGGDQFFGARVSLESVVLSAPALATAVYLRARHNRALLVATLCAAAASVAIHAYGAFERSIDPLEVERWAQIVSIVEDEFADHELGDVDLSRQSQPSGAIATDTDPHTRE